MLPGFRVPLLRRSDLSRDGFSSRAVRRELDERRLLLVRAGIFVRADDVADLTPEGRVIVRARALQLTARTPPVFVRTTAAALHGHPLYGCPTRPLHVAATPDRASGGVGVIRHDTALADDEIIEVGGMLCTSAARTVADVARTARHETAVCIADAALRSVAFARPGVFHTDRAEEFRAQAEEIARRSAHGRHRAGLALSFADGRAQLPGESVSRIRLIELGFAAPSLQVQVAGPNGGVFWVDLGLDDIFAFGEVDGKGKYRDVLLRRGLSMERVLEKEKQREDWILGTTQRRMARWGLPHARTALTLGDRLHTFGIVPPRTPRRR